MAAEATVELHREQGVLQERLRFHMNRRKHTGNVSETFVSPETSLFLYVFLLWPAELLKCVNLKL